MDNCRKCGGSMRGPIYVQGADMLRYTCKTCGFYESIEPLDKKKQKLFIELTEKPKS